jgi:serine/threonine protein kinase
MSPSPFLDPFHPYKIGPSVGKGDMGMVCQATDTTSGQVLAIKILDQFDLTTRMVRGGAIEVVKVAAGLTHTHLHPILKVLEADADTGKIAIVMPLAPARSLGDYLSAGKKIPARHAMNIIAKIGEALAFLHSQEVAHGSVKPTNVLLDKEVNPTLTDLPMAHLREYGLVPPQPTVLHQYYLPPEATYHGAPETRGDVFGLGVMAYHILTGRIPFSDPEPEARHGVPNPEGVPPLVYYVLLRAMTHRLELRYPTILAFMQDLQRATQGQIDPDTLRWFKVERKGEPPDSSPPSR